MPNDDGSGDDVTRQDSTIGTAAPSRRRFVQSIASGGAALVGLSSFGSASAQSTEQRSPALGSDGVSRSLASTVVTIADRNDGFLNLEKSIYRGKGAQATTLAYTPSPSSRGVYHFWVGTVIASTRERNLDTGEPADGKLYAYNKVYGDVATRSDDVQISRPTDGDRYGVFPHDGPQPSFSKAAEELLSGMLGFVRKQVDYLTTTANVVGALGVGDWLFGASEQTDVAGFRLSRDWTRTYLPATALQSNVGVIMPFTVRVPENATRNVSIVLGADGPGHPNPETRIDVELRRGADPALSWTASTDGTFTNQPIANAVDSDGNHRIGDQEILQAIEWWRNGEPVPGTDGHTLSDVEILGLIENWRNGVPVVT